MKIVNLKGVISVFFIFSCFAFPLFAKSIENVKNYRIVSPMLSSSGMPELDDFEMIASGGFKHVISLVPGDFSHEKEQVNFFNMSFEQIEVNWDKPELADFQRFVLLMESYQNKAKQEGAKVKVFVHCQLNYRASSFSYLYQVTQQGINKTIAEQQMLSVWQPNQTWQIFIENILTTYQK